VQGSMPRLLTNTGIVCQHIIKGAEQDKGSAQGIGKSSSMGCE
jgi:hypothetical protein